MCRKCHNENTQLGKRGEILCVIRLFVPMTVSSAKRVATVLGHWINVSVMSVNDTCKKLVARMVVLTMVGDRETAQEVYEEYLRENRLHITVREILEWKRAQQIA
jgi:hypothetical protein